MQKLCVAVYAVPIHRSLIADIGHMIRSFLAKRLSLVKRDDLRPLQDIVNKLIDNGNFQFIHAD